MSNLSIHTKDIKGLKHLFDSLYPALCLFANKYLDDMELSKDLVQEVYIKLWERKIRWTNYSRAKAYFYTSVKNRCLDRLRSKKNKMFIDDSVEALKDLESEDYFFSQMVTVETYDRLYKAINSLSSKTSKVIQLSLNGYTTNEIAEELASSPSTVRTQKTIAYQNLKKILGQINNILLSFWV